MAFQYHYCLLMVVRKRRIGGHDGKRLFDTFKIGVRVEPIALYHEWQELLNGCRQLPEVFYEDLVKVSGKAAKRGRVPVVPILGKYMIKGHIHNNTGISAIIFAEKLARSQEGGVSIHRGVDIAMDKDAFLHLVGVRFVLSALYIVANKVTNGKPLIFAREVDVSNKIHGLFLGIETEKVAKGLKAAGTGVLFWPAGVKAAGTGIKFIP